MPYNPGYVVSGSAPSLVGTNFTGTAAGLTTGTATTAGTVTTAAQPAITSTGTLTSLTVSGVSLIGIATSTASDGTYGFKVAGATGKIRFLGYSGGVAYMDAVNAGEGANIPLSIGATTIALTAPTTVTGAMVSTGANRMSFYGAGGATFDSSGNITSVSDARAKDTVAKFTKGLPELRRLAGPNIYNWKKETGLNTDDVNVSLYAQDLIAAGVTEAVFAHRTIDVMEEVETEQEVVSLTGAKRMETTKKLCVKKDANGEVCTKKVEADMMTVSDRAVIAWLVNVAKDLDAQHLALATALGK